jgi:hypothetical protein
MVEAGWKNARGNRGIADRSNSIEFPDWWAPAYAFRYFESDRRRSLLAFLSVIFDYPEEPGLMTEPLVVAGWLEFGKGLTPGDDWEYNDATLHLRVPNRQDDGTLLHLNAREIWPDKRHKTTRLTTLAVPLASVTNSEHLRNRVVEPLLRGIAESGPAC